MSEDVKIPKENNSMTVTITAAAGNVKFKDSAYSCILALIIDACNYCKYIGNGSTL